MNGWRHPALWALVAGTLIATRSVLGIGPWWVEPILWATALAVFAVWAGLWVRYRTFGPALWLGLFVSVWNPIATAVFWGTYARNNPDFAAESSAGLMLLSGLGAAVLFSILLGLLATVVGRLARRRAAHAVVVPPTP